ncbi:MAG TPA: serine protease [Pseudomonas sp.]
MNYPIIVGALLASLLPFSASAEITDFGDGLTNLSPSRILFNAQGQAKHWNGVGRIHSALGSSCTATLLDTRSPDSPPDAPAYLLTNGHCINRQNGLILTDEEIKGTIEFNFFTDSAARSYHLKRVRWSSMQGVDLAIVELVPTLQSLIDDGIQPLRLASQMPEPGRDVLWVGAPLYKDTGHLRLAACKHQASGEILEQPWVWRHTLRNQCKDTGTGASGSPLLLRDSQQIFGVLNTSTEGMPSDEENEALKAAGYPPQAADSNFGSPVIRLNDCFIGGLLSTDPERCSLFPTFSIRFKNPQMSHSYYARVRLDPEGRDIYPGWNLRFSADTPFYRYKQADHPLQCEDPVGYSAALSSRTAAIDEPIDRRIGINWLCLVGVNSADERPEPGLMRNALTLAVELQAAGPTPPPQMSIELNHAGTYVVRWLYESSLIDHYTLKAGPPETTDCSDPNGFRRRPGDSVLIPARSLLRKICTYAHDVNGQRSVVREDLLPAP